MLLISVSVLLLTNHCRLAGATSTRFLMKTNISKTPLQSAAALLEEDVGVLQQLNRTAQRFVDGTSPKQPIYVQDKPLSLKQYMIEILITWIIWAVLAVVAYFCCYRPMSPLPERKVHLSHSSAAEVSQHLEKLFSTGHFQCMQDSGICIFSFLCPSLRWADTTSLAGQMSFWAAFATFISVSFVNCISTGTIYGLFTTFLILHFRHKLREKLGMQSWTFLTCCGDCCFICWCPCCAIAQEARIVKDAIELGDDRFNTRVS